MAHEYQFTGDSARRPASPHPDSPRQAEPYVVVDGLREAVNLAIQLRRPLLLEGEAGCGKTRLARTVAFELGLPLYSWFIRSTSKAQEGLYSYDSLARLHDVQMRQVEEPTQEPLQGQRQRRRDPREPSQYVTLGPLGRAFTQRERPAVVLIDEIDKADLDFPNDLLSVLDDPWEFRIFEVDAVVRASPTCLPIVIITSNKEKGNLPLPFLRRCLYHYIDFPEDEARLKAIIDAHFGPRVPRLPTSLATAAVQRFLTLRQDSGLYKRPGTSELLDWIDALGRLQGLTPQMLAPEAPLPYPHALLKMRSDWQRYTGSHD